nr:unnamed protein product [Callosobruchus chinensis]
MAAIAKGGDIFLASSLLGSSDNTEQIPAYFLLTSFTESIRGDTEISFLGSHNDRSWNNLN